MEPNTVSSQIDELRYLSHSEFANRLLSFGVTAVAFTYEDGDQGGRMSDVVLSDSKGDEICEIVPHYLRLALEQRLEDNCLCHYHGRFMGCGSQRFEWNLES